MFARRLSGGFFKTVRHFSSGSKSLVAKYDEMLHKRPILTKCLTSAGLSLAADLICQVAFSVEFAKGFYKDIKIDWYRAAKFTTIGGVLVAPILHYWYGLLMVKIPGTSMLPVLKRLCLDQLLFAPVFLCTFFSSVLLLEGTPELIPSKLSTDLMPTVATNYAVWIPAQFVNFRFMPAHQQVFFSNIVGFFWNIYLSYVSYSKPDSISATAAATDSSDASAAKPIVENGTAAAAEGQVIVTDV